MQNIICFLLLRANLYWLIKTLNLWTYSIHYWSTVNFIPSIFKRLPNRFLSWLFTDLYISDIWTCSLLLMSLHFLMHPTPTIWFHARMRNYKCHFCFETVVGEIFNKKEQSVLCICRFGESFLLSAEGCCMRGLCGN